MTALQHLGNGLDCYCTQCRPRISARYNGAVCPGCGHRVLEDDWITTPDGEVWIHEECEDIVDAMLLIHGLLSCTILDYGARGSPL